MKAYALSEIGKVRKDNEDSFLAFGDQGLFCVADGMGGYAGGQVASSIAIRVLEQEAPSLCVKSENQGEEPLNCGQKLKNALQKANDQIFAQGRNGQYLGMGTTVTAALIRTGKLWIAHIGDSRAYLYREGQTSQLTQDHSLVNELLQQGELTEEEAQHHPRRHVLARALGVSASPEIDLLEVSIQNNDLLLLCTDGLYNQLSFEEISGILALKDSLRAKVKKMIDLALERGGNDNITAVLVSICEDQ